jgi:CDP-paratose 2-epimerase
MKILVTGGCGLVGYHLSKWNLEQGHEVHVFDNLERSKLLGHNISYKRKNFNKDVLTKMGVNVYHIDVSEFDQLHNFKKYEFEVIYHMAAQCGVPPSINNPIRDFQVNALGTLNMLEKARQDDSVFVYASTNKVYNLHEGWKLGGDRWEWSNPTWDEFGFPVDAGNYPGMLKGSRTPYGVSKYTGDLYCQEYANLFNVRTGVFRKSCIYGTNQFSFEEQGWATWFIIAALKDLPITVYGDGKQVRDMLWVEDTVAAYDAYAQAALEGRVKHGVWNLGGGPNFTLSINECIELVQELTGKKLKTTYTDWRPSDQKIYTSDIYPVCRDLNWKPLISPKDGLEKVVEWVKENIDVF